MKRSLVVAALASTLVLSACLPTESVPWMVNTYCAKDQTSREAYRTLVNNDLNGHKIMIVCAGDEPLDE